MATKNKPGAYDCYGKLAPDQPYFVLVGGDTLAGPLVTLWAMARAGKTDGTSFHNALADLRMAAAAKGPADPDKIIEAMQTASAINEWGCEHEKVDTGTASNKARGFRPGYCRKCKMDMTEDSSD